MKNTLKIEEDEAKIVRQIYNLYIDGIGYAAIAKELNLKGISPPGDKKNLFSSQKWNAVAIQRILTNRVYLGDTVQGVSEKISFKTKKTRRLPKECWCITENTHPSIIDKFLFNSVQSKILSKKTTFSGTYKHKPNCFTGLIYCGKCGSAMYARKRSNRPMGYVCSNYVVNGSSACTSHYIREDEIFTLLADEISMFISNDKMCSLLQKQVDEFFDKTSNATDRERKQKLLYQKNRHQEALYMDKLEGKISEELFLRMNKNLEEQMEKIKHQITQSNESISKINCISLLHEILTISKHNELNNELVQILINKITIYDKGECLQLPSHGDNSFMKEIYGALEIEFTY